MEYVDPEGAEAYANKYTDEQKKPIIEKMKQFHFNLSPTDINLLCAEMYDDRKFDAYHIRKLTQDQFASIIKGMRSDWYDDHTEQYAYQNTNKKVSKKHLIKEEMEPGYWEKVEQYKKDIQAYLDKGDGEEYDGFEGYVDEDDFYTTIEEIAAQNKDKIPALENELLSYIDGCPGGDSGDSMDGSLGLYQDIMEGNEGYAESNIFYGLTDPETWTNLGFNVPEELAVLLKQHFVDCVDPDGSFWEGWGNDGADDSAQDTLNKIGLSKVVEAIEKIRSGEYDDQDQDDQDYDDED